MENATTYEVTSEGMPINPYNEALPPEGCTLDKGEVNIATGGYSKKATAASLCLKNVDDLDKGIVRMAQECKALAALLICLLTPVVSIFGARLPKWNAIEAVYDDTIASIEDGDYNPTTAELQDAFRTKDVRRLAVKAIYQVAHWIRPPGAEEEDDPLSGRTLQFHHYYHGMDKWQTYYVFQLLSLIRRDFSRKEGVQWLDWERPDGNSKRTKKMRSCDQLRAALGSYAEDQGVYQNLVAPLPLQTMRDSHTAKQPSRSKTQARASAGGRGAAARGKTTKSKRVPSNRAKKPSETEYRRPQVSSGMRDGFSDRINAEMTDRRQDNEHPITQEGATPSSSTVREKKQTPPSVNVYHPILGHIKLFASDEHPKSVEPTDS